MKTESRKAFGEPAPEMPSANSSRHHRGRTASWVIKNKNTGEVMFETFNANAVARLNTEKYEAIPIGDHLESLESCHWRRAVNPVKENPMSRTKEKKRKCIRCHRRYTSDAYCEPCGEAVFKIDTGHALPRQKTPASKERK